MSTTQPSAPVSTVARHARRSRGTRPMLAALGAAALASAWSGGAAAQAIFRNYSPTTCMPATVSTSGGPAPTAIFSAFYGQLAPNPVTGGGNVFCPLIEDSYFDLTNSSYSYYYPWVIVDGWASGTTLGNTLAFQACKTYSFGTGGGCSVWFRPSTTGVVHVTDGMEHWDLGGIARPSDSFYLEVQMTGTSTLFGIRTGEVQ